MGEIMEPNASVIYFYLPKHYFESSRTSMIQIYFKKSSFDRPNFDTAEFEHNSFRNNKHIQIIALGNLSYRGSLIYVNSEVDKATFGF